MSGLATGLLDRRIRIERPITTDDGRQTRVDEWTPLATVWAQYKPARGNERLEMASRQAEQPVAFVIRWSSKVAGVGPSDRVRYPATDDGQVFEIVAPPVEIGRREGLELMCIAAVGG